MAGRFYYAPQDPGYGQFGSAIAQGLGAGIQNYQRGQAQQEEQKRYETEQERVAQQMEMARRAQAIQDAINGVQWGAPEATPPAAMPVPPIVGAFTPGAEGRTMPAPALPAGPTMAMPAPDIGPGPALALPQTRAPAAAVQAPGAGNVIRGAYGDEQFTIDPTRSASFVGQQAAEEGRMARTQQATQAAREELRNAIDQALQDGITPAEAAYMKSAYGISYEDLQDPDKAYEKAWERKKDELTFAHQLDLQKISARERSDRRQLTAGQARTATIENALGHAMLQHDEGKDFPTIYDELRSDPELVAAIGGEGALGWHINRALSEKEAITANQAASLARDNILGQGLVPGAPGFDRAVMDETNRIRRTLREQQALDARERRASRNPTPRRGAPTDSGFTFGRAIEGASGRGSEQQRDWDAAAAALKARDPKAKPENVLGPRPR
jgi:hypothetical protein